MLRPSSLVRESMTRESAWRQNGQCMAETAYAGNPVSVLEPGGDRLAVGRQGLGFGQRHDRVVDSGQGLAVVLDDLLRSQERRRGETGRVPRLTAGRQHVVAAGEVVAQADR